MNNTNTRLFQGAALLTLLLDVACGGTMDLSPAPGAPADVTTGGASNTAGVGNPNPGGSSSSFAGADCATAGNGIGGATPSYGGHSSAGLEDWQGSGGESPADDAGAPSYGGHSSGESAGAPSVGGHSSGGISGATSGAGGWSSTEQTCTVDEDCIECTMQTDPADSGCYIPCCASTAMTLVACAQHTQSFNALCPKAGCTAVCMEKPHPVCSNGQCVHAP